MTKKNYSTLIILIAICCIAFVFDVIYGSVEIPLSAFFDLLGNTNENNTFRQIVLDYRLPKALTAVLAGAGLSVTGLQLQTLFRNPLAGPDVLGISSGASLGAAIATMAASSLSFLASWNGSATTVTAASMGAFLVLGCIMIVSFRMKDHVSILILGLMIAQMAGAAEGLIQYFSKASDLQGFVIWGMGSFSNVTYDGLKILFVCVSFGLLVSLLSSKFLNAILLGENYAKSVGMNLKILRFSVIISTGLMTGCITAFCGPVVFIGIAVPHLIKRLINSTDHFVLIPLVALSGSFITLVCDLTAHLPFFSNVLPVNIITSLIGAPVVIWIILKQRRIHSYH